jgi:hypothetical protein
MSAWSRFAKAIRRDGVTALTFSMRALVATAICYAAGLMRSTVWRAGRTAASRASRLAGAGMLALCGVWTCGGETADGNGPSPGMNAGSGGNAGSSTSVGGSVATGGVATGGVATGGVSSAGAASLPECETDDDCEIAKDCCSCEALPKGTSVPTCRLACGDSNGCEMQGITATARCALGRCALSAGCGGPGVTCDEQPPRCSEGHAPIVTAEGCWGPCVPATECLEVPDCSVCGDEHCVSFPNVGGTLIRCVARRPGCEAGNLCECLAPCGRYGCGERDGEVGCYCAGC